MENFVRILITLHWHFSNKVLLFFQTIRKDVRNLVRCFFYIVFLHVSYSKPPSIKQQQGKNNERI